MMDTFSASEGKVTNSIQCGLLTLYHTDAEGHVSLHGINSAHHPTRYQRRLRLLQSRK